MSDPWHKIATEIASNVINGARSLKHSGSKPRGMTNCMVAILLKCGLIGFKIEGGGPGSRLMASGVGGCELVAKTAILLR